MPALFVHGGTPALESLGEQLAPRGIEVTLGDVLPARPFDGILVRADADAARFLDKLDPERLARTVLLLESPSSSSTAYLELPLGGFVVKTMALGVDELVAVVDTLLAANRFGVERYLGPDPIIHRAVVQDAANRGDTLDALDRFFAEQNLDSRLLGQMLTVADEFVTNAFYNAPVDKQGRRHFAHMSRLERLPPDRPVELSYGSDGKIAFVSVVDTYGSLERRALQASLTQALGDAAVNLTSGGAGLGIVTAFRSASRIVFNVTPGERTECLGFVDVSGGYRRFVERGRSLQAFFTPSHRGHGSNP